MVTKKDEISNSKALLGWEDKDMEYTTWRSALKNYYKRWETEQKLQLAIAEQQRDNAITGGDILDSVGEELLDIGKKTPMKVFICDPEVQECYLGSNDALRWETCPTKVVFTLKTWSLQEMVTAIPKRVLAGKFPCTIYGATTKPRANASVLETDVICLLSDTELEALLERTNYKPVCLLVVLNTATHEDTPDPKEIGSWLEPMGRWERRNLNLNWMMVIPEKLQEWQLGLLHSTTGSGQRESFEITCKGNVTWERSDAADRFWSGIAAACQRLSDTMDRLTDLNRSHELPTKDAYRPVPD
ncbi:hypothetical protein BDZ91DRAFT_769116 [Kalaharituber pfeilii]|nr:hypothetical protein BDZ91DRAFT_769116 [Kalaharituber pfeilii]